MIQDNLVDVIEFKVPLGSTSRLVEDNIRDPKTTNKNSIANIMQANFNYPVLPVNLLRNENIKLCCNPTRAGPNMTLHHAPRANLLTCAKIYYI